MYHGHLPRPSDMRDIHGYHPVKRRKAAWGRMTRWKKMFQELTGFEKKNISLRINGVPASPMQIVQAHTMCEHQAYMRDYVLNDKGDVKEVVVPEYSNLMEENM